LPDLQESFQCKAAAVLPVAADDDVIQKAYSKQGARIPYGDRESGVIIRGLSGTGGMVMNEDEEGGSRADCLSYDQRRVSNHP
jgi:hypothetical protein